MDIEDLKQMKKQAELTNQEIADLSGIPVSTVNKIFSGATKNPRYASLLAIEQVLAKKEKIPFYYDDLKEEPAILREETVPYMYSAREYDGEDIERLSEWSRAELINGKLYMLSAPNRLHQYFVKGLVFDIESHIRKKKGGCQVYTSPFDVRLFGDDSTVVQPDILVVCNRDILTEKGCSGAPDWVIEIVSKSNSSHDYVRKLMQYQKAGVREYWIVDPEKERTTVYRYAEDAAPIIFPFHSPVSAGLYPDLEILISSLLKDM